MTEPAIDALEVVWTSTIALGHEISEREWALPTDLPGWSVKDNLAHIIGIERMMRGEPSPTVTPAETGHLRNPIGEANELWVESYRALSGGEVLAAFEVLAAERLADFRALTPEQLAEVGPTPVGMAPFRDFIAVRVMDSWAHEQDMRRAVGRPGDLEGPAVDLSLGRITKTMPLVVGKRASAPDGSCVVFDVVGPAGATIPVVVSGRAAIAEAVPSDPSVTLTMDVETYAAVAFGRWDPTTALEEGRITITGDEELGRSVVHAMNFMI